MINNIFSHEPTFENVYPAHIVLNREKYNVTRNFLLKTDGTKDFHKFTIEPNQEIVFHEYIKDAFTAIICMNPNATYNISGRTIGANVIIPYVKGIRLLTGGEIFIYHGFDSEYNYIFRPLQYLALTHDNNILSYIYVDKTIHLVFVFEKGGITNLDLFHSKMRECMAEIELYNQSHLLKAGNIVR
jgi:hypothetical protein